MRFDRRRLLAAGGAALAAGPAWARKASRAPAPADLTGVWTSAWYTQLQRPKDFKTLAVSPADAEAYEKPRRNHAGELVGDPHDELGQAESEFPDNGPGLARIRGEIRSSWIVDPADGRIPWTPAARDRRKADSKRSESIDNVEVRDTDERCLTSNGTGAPLVNAHDANLITIVQTPGAVAIVSERNHDARIVRLDGGPAASPEPASWWGCSTGRWEGATLVVETKDFRPGLTKITDDLSISDRTRIVERFTRTGPREITYRFEVTDPTLFTQTWKGEMVLRPAEGQMYEYACHEGNYSLPTILSRPR